MTTPIVGKHVYDTVNGVQTYADLRGYDVIITPDACFRAMIFIESLNYKGSPTEDDQDLRWPRKNVVYDGLVLPDDEVPSKVKNAFREGAVIESKNPGALVPTQPGPGKVKREKVDVIEVEYFEPRDDRNVDYTFPVLIWLQGLLKDSNVRNIRMGLM